MGQEMDTELQQKLSDLKDADALRVLAAMTKPRLRTGESLPEWSTGLADALAGWTGVG